MESSLELLMVEIGEFSSKLSCGSYMDNIQNITENVYIISHNRNLLVSEFLIGMVDQLCNGHKK